MDLKKLKNCLQIMLECNRGSKCDLHCERCDLYIGHKLEAETLQEAIRIVGATGWKGVIMKWLWT